MHNNYHFLIPLSKELGGEIIGGRIEECYSQEKDELILRVATGDHPFLIRAYFSPNFACLMFPEDHIRAKKNTIDLFPEIIGRTINEVKLHSFERAISLILSGDLTLTFKLFGNRSNVILFKNQEVSHIFRGSLKQDLELQWDELDRQLDLSISALEAVDGDPVKFCPTLGRPLRSYLTEQGYDAMDPGAKHEHLMGFISQLSEAPFYVVEKDEKFKLLLYPDGEILHEFGQAIPTINRFFITHQREGQLRSEKKRAVDSLVRIVERGQRYIAKNESKLSKLQEEGKYQQTADLIMANLHAFAGGKTEAEVLNFYNENAPLTLRIKPGISPQKHAEQLYRKAKNQHIEIDNLEKNIAERLKLVEEYQEKLEKVKEAEDLKSLRSLVGKPQTVRATQDPETLPYRPFEYEGYQIWIGKSGKGNDDMLRLCHKDDLWLHAKDVAGSHVIIRRKPGSGIPASVKERAAEVAAHNSKRKQDTLCPVIVTPRKYVRKRKGDPAGMVRVDREEEVLLVTPTP